MDYKLLFLSELLFGCLTAVVARSRGRSPWLWFVMGMLLTWIALIILLFLPASSTEKSEEVFFAPKILGKKSSWDLTTDWFYVDRNKKVQGPISASALKELWKKEELSLETWIWHESIEDWKTIKDIETFISWIETTGYP